MRCGIILTFVVVLAAPAFAQGYGESPYIFGIHEPGGEHHMAEKGKKGWILFTEGIGRNPAEMNGEDFRPWADQGYGVIVRINHGYGPTTGTLPYDYHYDDFAQRVANYVQNSPGAHLWIIGNETNLPGEWPRYDGPEQQITVDRYVSCFIKCRSRIKALPGHAGDQVIPAPAATWAANDLMALLLPVGIRDGFPSTIRIGGGKGTSLLAGRPRTSVRRRGRSSGAERLEPGRAPCGETRKIKWIRKYPGKGIVY